MKIGVIGCGRWGTCIAWYLDMLGNEVTLYGRSGSENMKRLMQSRSNEHIVIPKTIKLSEDICEALSGEVTVISVPSQQLSSLCGEISALGVKNKIFVLCMKGIEISSLRRLSRVVAEETDASNSVAVWLGPGHVEEFYRKIPNCMVIDSENEGLKKYLADAFSSDIIRFYYGNDIIGNEIGAASKNVVGIAAGMLDGLGFSSLKGALMSRGTREIARLVKAEGGNELSVYGLCHLGDYEATVFSKYSNNRGFGEGFVRGEKNNDKLAEGFYTVKALVKMAERDNVELPICQAVYNILYNGEPARQQLGTLFSRSVKFEL